MAVLPMTIDHIHLDITTNCLPSYSNKHCQCLLIIFIWFLHVTSLILLCKILFHTDKLKVYCFCTRDDHSEFIHKWHIYVTGHSLGGALATLLALELSSNQLAK